MARPATHVIAKDVKRANSTAPSAGTTCSVSVVESSCASDDARMPTKPATSVARIVFMSASRFGDRPASSAFASLSEAARVARPKRVYL